MMKKTTIILALCALTLIAGCGKKKEEEVAITPASAEEVETVISPTEFPLEGAVITRTPIKGTPVTDTPDPTATPEPTSTPTPTPTPEPTTTPTPMPTSAPTPTDVPESVASDYLPPSGYYTNGSGEDFCSMSIGAIDAGSFSFSITRGGSGETVFSTHTATFEQAGSSTAVYRGSDYTLYFDCSSYGTVSVSGFDAGGSGNTFWNTDIHAAG